MHFQSHNHDFFEKTNWKYILAGLFPRIIPHCPPKHSWETLDMGGIPTNRQNRTHLPHQKNPLYEIYFTIKSIIPSP